MNVKKLGFLILGVGLVCLALYDLVSGETYFFGAGSTSIRAVSWEHRPIKFVLSIIVELLIGVACIKSGLSSKPLDD